MKRLAAILICLVLLGSILTGCSPTETISGKADVEESIADWKLEIRSGILYITVYDGTIYKTRIEADEISVLRPTFDEGGTVCTATLYKDHKEVDIINRSYVDDYNVTEEDLEERVGPVTKVVLADE